MLKGFLWGRVRSRKEARRIIAAGSALAALGCAGILLTAIPAAGPAIGFAPSLLLGLAMAALIGAMLFWTSRLAAIALLVLHLIPVLFTGGLAIDMLKLGPAYGLNPLPYVLTASFYVGVIWVVARCVKATNALRRLAESGESGPEIFD